MDELSDREEQTTLLSKNKQASGLSISSVWVDEPSRLFNIGAALS